MQLKELERLFGATFLDDFEFSTFVVPRAIAPVVVQRESGLNLEGMQFSLLPSFSKEDRVTYATHNARIETVSVKPTWKKAFRSMRCIVPISMFIEPAYWGTLAGNMVSFFKEGGLLACAAIYDQWTDRKSGKSINSFALLAQAAGVKVDQFGHDRQPIFLEQSGWEAWLDKKEREPAELLDILRTNFSNVDFNVAIERSMKNGWEKRAAEHVAFRNMNINPLGPNF